MVLIDAGPLVALIHARDKHHARCRAAFERIAEPVLTVWPAFTEAMYLLGFSGKAQGALWEMLERRAVTMAELGPDDFPRLRELMHKYRDRPMDLADAALVRAAEREKIRTIFTLDQVDFRIYQPRGSGPFEIIPDL